MEGAIGAVKNEKKKEVGAGEEKEVKESDV